MRVRLLLIPAVVLVVALVVFFALRSKPEVQVADEVQLVGRWKLVDVQVGADGERPVFGPAEWVIREDGGVTTTEKGQPPHTGAIKLDPTLNPKVFEITAEGTDRPTHGVYSLRGDTLTLCWCRKPDGPRPTELQADASTATHVLTFERVKDR